ALNLEGKIALSVGELTQAQKSFTEAGKVASEIQALPILLDALVGLATLAAQSGQHERALQWAVHILQHPSSTQDTRNRTEGLRLELETQLTAQQIETIRLRGQSITLQEILQEAWMK
ncbi:MAG TPA: hypothetical protein VKE92_16005, partial [Anaerolineales bacterium]|nr:hypothetical protein [Anaerolineales bacterium]